MSDEVSENTGAELSLEDLVRSFKTLPVDHKEAVLSYAANLIRRIQAVNPEAADRLQTIFDRLYLIAQQELADQAFDERSMSIWKRLKTFFCDHFYVCDPQIMRLTCARCAKTIRYYRTNITKVPKTGGRLGN